MSPTEQEAMSSIHQRPSPRVQDANTFWARLSPTARHGACLALILAVAMAFYAPALFEGKTIHGVDNVSWRANAEVLMEHEEQTGERALWNPNVFSGMPAFMISYKLVIPQLDTVINQTRPVAWPVSHLFLMMVGVYLLVFYLTRNHLSGALSGLAFGFTTYIPIILSVGHGTKFVALAYAPYVLLAFVYTLRNPSLLGGLLFAGALALQLRAKHPQIAYYVLMLGLIWWIVELVGAWKNEEMSAFAKSTGWLGLGTGLALLTVAHPYLAIYQYKQFSVRGAEVAAGGGGGGAMEWAKAMRWSQGPKELLTLVVAEIFGGGGQTYWGPKTFTEGPHYVGGVVVALAGMAVWRVRTWLVWGLGGGVLGTILFSMGKHASWINWPFFEYFPFFDAFRAPETWLSVTALGLAVLAGVGLDYALRQTSTRGKRRAQRADLRERSLLWAFGAVFGLVGLLWLAPNTFLDFEKPNEAQRVTRMLLQQNPNVSPDDPRVERAVQQQMQKVKRERRSAFRTDAQRTLLFLFLAAGALVLYRQENIQPWLAGLIVVGVVTVDLWGVDKRYLGADTYSSAQDPEQEIPTYRFDQFLQKKRKEAGGPGHFRILSLAEGNPTNTARPSYYYESVGGYHGAKLQRYQNYLDHILQLNQPGAPNENALDLMNTRYIVSRKKLPGTEVAYRSQKSGVRVLRNPDAVPRGFFVGDTEVVRQPKRTWKRLRSEDFDPRQTALLPKPLDAPVTPLDSASTTEVTLEQYTPNEIEWTLQTGAPRLFVTSEVHYPAGWNAYLDGEKVPIRRVDYLLRGVHVPAGQHTLVMRFEPKADRIGIWIAGTTTALVYGGIFLLVGLQARRRWGFADDNEAESDDE